MSDSCPVAPRSNLLQSRPLQPECGRLFRCRVQWGVRADLHVYNYIRMSWFNLGGMNPKFSEFKDKHQGITMLGLSWALYWRFAVVVLAIEILLFAIIFGIAAAFGVSMHHDREWNRGPGMHGKLNITAVCESALAYMTFTDGASADAFVEECKDGKHPEVIQRYKADMNLDGATI